MIRSLFYASSVIAVVALAFWAYGVGYETRAVEREVSRIEARIGVRQQELSMLRAEWAYLNRPDRLHALAEMNFESLGLMPLTPEHFALTDQVAYPPPGREETRQRWAAVEHLEEEIDGVVIMNHVFGADAEPQEVAPPTLADDGEQLP